LQQEVRHCQLFWQGQEQQVPLQVLQQGQLLLERQQEPQRPQERQQEQQEQQEQQQERQQEQQEQQQERQQGQVWLVQVWPEQVCLEQGWLN
jgi:hypothetical protein